MTTRERQKFKGNMLLSLEEKAFPLFFLLALLREAKRIRETNKFIKTNEIKKYSASDNYLSTLKSSDTLFVMGSGASINNLERKDWEKIRNADSLGFNLWLIHDFVPTYYMFEPLKYSERAQAFRKLLALKADKYSKVPLIGIYNDRTDISHFPQALRKNIYMSFFAIPGSTRDGFRKSIKIINFLKLYRANFLFGKRATIVRGILFGLQMKYKRIVLCGVDLNNTKYFYEDEKYLRGDVPVPKNYQLGTVHNTLNSDYWELTVDTVIKEINQSILKPNNIELYIGSKKSALYPTLPYFFS